MIKTGHFTTTEMSDNDAEIENPRLNIQMHDFQMMEQPV